MKIAIIGAGISGLGAAYLLNQAHDVTVFEKNAVAGGHSRTIDVNGQPVDTGFIVYNEKNYPLLTGLFRHLKVPTQDSEMSFGVSIGNGFLEYNSKSLLADPRNLLRPAFWGMIRDIVKFNRTAKKFLSRPEITLGQCLDEMKMGTWFRRYYLQAMGAAIWSCSVDVILSFPAATFVRFFDNHGLLTLTDQPQWRTVTGGSKAYVEKLVAGFREKIRTDCAITRVARNEDGVLLTDATGRQYAFDHVIFATHAPQALAMLEHPTAEEKRMLGACKTQENLVVTHHDESFMPHRKSSWASWVYLSEAETDASPVVSLTYWMNNLQGIPRETPVFVTLNPGRMPRSSYVHDTHIFSHPVFTADAVRAQGEISSIQGKNRTHYCGAWLRYGFHEDGLLSAVTAAKDLGVGLPWT